VLELERNVMCGLFVETGSFIHRMDARVKIAATSVLIVASFLIDDFPGFAVVLPLLIVIGVVSRIPLGYVLQGSRIFIAFLGFILAFQVLFYARDLPESSYLWRWGILSVSTEGLYTAGILALRVILLYYVTTMLMLTTSLVDLTNGLELIFGPLQRLRVPVNELVLVFVIAIKFVPIFISGFARADTLTIAMNTRSYRGGRYRTKLRQMRANPSDWLALTLVIAWITVAWLM
jgi:energy-coupling factor transport system permease protein